MKVNQIWIGEAMPPRCMDTVRGAASEYRFWGWEQLKEKYDDDAMTALFDRLMRLHPRPVTYALVSDYYRWRVVEQGGIYLDADIECRDEDVFSWLALLEDGLWTIAERRMPTRACNAVIFAQGDEACKGLASVVQGMRERLAKLFPQGGTLDELVAVVRRDDAGSGIAVKGIGPGFIRTLAQQYSIRVMDHDLASASDARAALFHHGDGSWLERKDEYKLEVTSVITPSWCRAQSRASRPPAARARVSRGKSDQLLVVPRGTRRIVVFSNVPSFDVTRVGLRSGDHCIHLNRARQWAKVSAIEGVTHSLLVRRGSTRKNQGKPHWFSPVGGVDGYEQVLFINDAQLMRARPWWTRYRAELGKSPTTGFIAYHLAKELKLPIVLAGFAPDTPSGTPMWKGHAWAHEAQVYRGEGVCIIPP